MLEQQNGIDLDTYGQPIPYLTQNTHPEAHGLLHHSSAPMFPDPHAGNLRPRPLSTGTLRAARIVANCS